MFRHAPEEGRSPKLKCAVCGFVVKEIPLHCGAPMKWKLSKSFRKVQSFGCQFCERSAAMPDHCGVPMIYSNSDYVDIPDLTELDFKEMSKAYSAGLKEDKDVTS